MSRIISFIDGFNLYHALIHKKASGVSPYSAYRWLDYWKLSECFVEPEDNLEAVYYFTAYADWKISSKERHRKFVAALRTRGVSVIFGRFFEKTRDCKAQCKQTFVTHEEKRTDVSIAIYMLKLAVLDKYDKAILISGDSDLKPALDAIRQLYPSKGMIVVPPIGRTARALGSGSILLEMKLRHLKSSLLPQAVVLSDGSTVTCPPGWM